MTPELPLEFHPDTGQFPLLEGDEFEKLKQDIARNGLREPIWIDEHDQIVDGRNRYRAWRELHGDEPIPHRYVPEGASISAFAFSLNVLRHDYPTLMRNIWVYRMEKRITDEARNWEEEVSVHATRTLEAIRSAPKTFKPSPCLRDTLVELARLAGELAKRAAP